MGSQIDDSEGAQIREHMLDRVAISKPEVLNDTDACAGQPLRLIRFSPQARVPPDRGMTRVAV
jgi:hypothetical protein